MTSTGGAANTSTACVPQPTCVNDPCDNDEDGCAGATCQSDYIIDRSLPGVGLTRRTVLSKSCVPNLRLDLCISTTPTASVTDSVIISAGTAVQTTQPYVTAAQVDNTISQLTTEGVATTTQAAVACAPQPTCINDRCDTNEDCCDGAVCEISIPLPRRGLHRRNNGSCVPNPRIDFCTATSSLAGTTVVPSTTVGTEEGTSAPSNIASSTGTSSPTTMTDLAGYTYLGCYSEATGKRALSDFQQFYGQGDRNDVESCSAACSDYTYFGVEFGSECYCGNNINLGSLPQAGLAPD